MNVYLIPPEYVKEVYSDIEKHLERLVPTTNGRFEKIDILHDLLVGIENLWVVVEEDETIPVGIIITQVSHYPRKSMLSIQYAAGDRLDEWIDEGLQTMENWAVDNCGFCALQTFDWNIYVDECCQDNDVNSTGYLSDNVKLRAALPVVIA